MGSAPRRGGTISLFADCAIVLAILCIAFASLARVDAAADDQAITRASIKLPKLFDFGQFKQMFKRNYSSLLEEVARRKIYLARAFKAFTSGVSYKFRRSRFYLAINSMSDWTVQEYQKISLSIRHAIRHDKEQLMKEFGGDHDEDDDEDHDDESSSGDKYQIERHTDDGEELIINQEVADLDDIKDQLVEVMSEHSSEPGFKEIANELNAAGQEANEGRRRKRDVSPNNGQSQIRRDFSLDQLMHSPEVHERSTKIVQKVASNNPDYEEPELPSFGKLDEIELDAENGAPKLGQKAARLLSELPGAQFVSNWITFAANKIAETLPNDEEDDYEHFEESDEDDDDDDDLDSDGQVNTENHTRIRMSSTGLALLIPPSDGEEIDHRLSDCFFEPRDQSECGSCYAFAAVSLFEWAHCMATGDLVGFSEQYIVDCGRRFDKDLHGCNGSNARSTGLFVEKAGLELRTNYAYRNKEETCPYPERTDISAMGYLRFEKGGLVEIPLHQVDRVLKKAPMFVGIFLSFNFHQYGGGVDDSLECNYKDGHAMVLVGKGVEDGLDYYLLRNSHGVSYGLAGYYKLNRVAFYKCSFNEFAYYPKVRFASNASRGPQRNYDPRPVKSLHKRQLRRQLREEQERQRMQDEKERLAEQQRKYKEQQKKLEEDRLRRQEEQRKKYEEVRQQRIEQQKIAQEEAIRRREEVDKQLQDVKQRLADFDARQKAREDKRNEKFEADMKARIEELRRIETEQVAERAKRERVRPTYTHREVREPRKNPARKFPAHSIKLKDTLMRTSPSGDHGDVDENGLDLSLKL